VTLTAPFDASTAKVEKNKKSQKEIICGNATQTRAPRIKKNLLTTFGALFMKGSGD